jgi:hypothetical protein
VGSCLCHLKLLGDAFSCHIAHPSQRRRKTSLQASWPVNNEGDVKQSTTVEPRLQLKSLLEHFPILLVGGVFNGDSVVTLAYLTVFLHFALSLLWYVFESRGELGRRHTWRCHPANNNLGECDYTKPISTQR